MNCPRSQIVFRLVAVVVVFFWSAPLCEAVTPSLGARAGQQQEQVSGSVGGEPDDDPSAPLQLWGRHCKNLVWTGANAALVGNYLSTSSCLTPYVGRDITQAEGTAICCCLAGCGLGGAYALSNACVSTREWLQGLSRQLSEQVEELDALQEWLEGRSRELSERVEEEVASAAPQQQRMEGAAPDDTRADTALARQEVQDTHAGRGTGRRQQAQPNQGSLLAVNRSRQAPTPSGARWRSGRHSS
ncbi:unnamed protein product [Amoebophrya sp. A120]|nr:unnamed protein product [Amoebophrya sp. A120]|eukprot:GSA120T00018396001.1